MSAITLYSIANVLIWAKAREDAHRAPAEVIRFPHIPVLTRKWTMEVDENGTRRLVAHWAKNQ